jgi:hypothetical protein
LSQPQILTTGKNKFFAIFKENILPYPGRSTVHLRFERFYYITDHKDCIPALFRARIKYPCPVHACEKVERIGLIIQLLDVQLTHNILFRRKLLEPIRVFWKKGGAANSGKIFGEGVPFRENFWAWISSPNLLKKWIQFIALKEVNTRNIKPFFYRG